MFNSSMPFTMNVEPSGNYNNGNNGMWGDGAWWIVILLIFAWGGFGNGFGNGFGGGNRSGSIDNYVLGSDFSMLSRQMSDGFNSQERKLDSISNGICSLGYDQLAQMNGINTNILQSSNALQAQLAQCCCDLKTGQMQISNNVERGFCDTNYNLATNTNAIIQNAHSDTDRVIAKLDAIEMSRKDETIDALRSQVNALNLAQSQANQNAFIIANQEAQTAELLRRLGRDCPTPAYIVPNPNCCYYPSQFYNGFGNNNCGCGCG